MVAAKTNTPKTTIADDIRPTFFKAMLIGNTNYQGLRDVLDLV